MWFFPVWGLALWLVATIIIRFTGQHYLHPDHPYLSFFTFLLTVPLIAVATFTVYDWRRVSLPDRPTAAILLCLPGLLLDIPVMVWFERVYPNLEGAAGLFGAWLLWAYALVLISGVVPYTRMWKM
jgi:hypothetical protein